MATIDKKPRSEAALARAIYSDLAKAQDAREKPRDQGQAGDAHFNKMGFVRKPTRTERSK